MTRTLQSIVAIVAVSSVWSACDGGSDDASGGAGGVGGGNNADVTFHRDIEPILHASCSNCHFKDRIGPFPLVTYEDAKDVAALLAAQVEARLMPPFHAQETDTCVPLRSWKDDVRLTDEQIAKFKAWAAAGAPKGDPKDAPPAFVPKEPGLANPSVTLTPKTPAVVDGSKDTFQCVVYDPELTEDKIIDGLQFVAGNAKVAHHALVFRIPRDEAAALSAGNERFDCFGAPPGELLQGWAPGGIPLELPKGIGIAISQDDVIIVQMHYHPTGDSSENDSSTVALRFTETKPDWLFQVSLPGNAGSAAGGLLPGPNDSGGPEFRIPANAEDHTEEMLIQVPDLPIDIPILLVATHMHYVGVDMSLSIERSAPSAGEPEKECLLQTPRWDFNWQRFYQYDVAIDDLPKVSTGDTLRLKCRYDNSMKNPFVAKALADQGMSAPVDVRLGETTLDEMCLAGVGILVPNL
jgi:hypothetical protein